MATVYLNLAPENSAYLTTQATAGRTTKAHVADAIISEARRLGWIIEHGPAVKVVRPDDSHSGAASGSAACDPPRSRGPAPAHE
jgi:hypothetical protein